MHPQSMFWQDMNVFLNSVSIAEVIHPSHSAGLSEEGRADSCYKRSKMLLIVCREFRLSDDMFAQDSIELLKQSGIDFAKMEARGIDVSNFGELLMSSGIVLNEDVSHLGICCVDAHAAFSTPCLHLVMV